MECGKYKVIDDIHVFDCDLGQLKVPKEKIIEIKEGWYRLIGCADGIEFPARLLDTCKLQLQRIYD